MRICSKLILGIIASYALVAFGIHESNAADRINGWQYLNVAQFSVPGEYKLSVDSKGLPHLLLRGLSNEGSSLVYQFWSNDQWNRSIIKKIDGDTYINDLFIFLAGC